MEYYLRGRGTYCVNCSSLFFNTMQYANVRDYPGSVLNQFFISKY